MDKIFLVISCDDLFSFYQVIINDLFVGFMVRPVDTEVDFYFNKRSLAVEFMNQYKYPHSSDFWSKRKRPINSLEFLLKSFASDGRSRLLINS